MATERVQRRSKRQRNEKLRREAPAEQLHHLARSGRELLEVISDGRELTPEFGEDAAAPPGNSRDDGERCPNDKYDSQDEQENLGMASLVSRLVEMK